MKEQAPHVEGGFFPSLPVIRGSFAIVGYEPDGDSIRFIPTHPDALGHLRRSHLIRPSKQDGSVQLRFEGVDATELHYGSARQPLGDKARDALLGWLGFANETFEAAAPTKIRSATPNKVSGAILSASADPFGRPISYVLLEKDAPATASATVDEALLKKTLNFRLLDTGTAYYTVYSSMPRAHRKIFRAVAAASRAANKGIWDVDSTAEFVLVDEPSISPPTGACILPKLFRRCTDYLKAKTGGFHGNLRDWIISISQTPSRNENDGVIIWNEAHPKDSVQVHIADLIEQRNQTIAFQGDLLDLVFLEK